MAEADSIPSTTAPQDPSVANVTVAINYSLPELEQFVSHYGSSLNRGPPGLSSGVIHAGIGTPCTKQGAPFAPSGGVPTAPDQTGTPGLSRCVSDDQIKSDGDRSGSTPEPDLDDDDRGALCRRTRRKITPKKVQREKSSVRYSMNLVPEARRNLEFLHYWRVGEATLHERLRLQNERQQARRHEQAKANATHDAPPAQAQRRPSLGGTTTSTQVPDGTRPHSVKDEAAPQIGPGWTVRTVARAGGGKAKCDKFFYSPTGRRFKSMAEVNKYKHDMEKETGVDVGPAMKRPSRISSRLRKKGKEGREPSAAAARDAADKTEAAKKEPCETCKHFPFCSKAPHPHHPPAPGAASAATTTKPPQQQPFLGNESVVWVPHSRSEWDECADEMTAACYSAALRRYWYAEEQKEQSAAAAAASAASSDGKPKTKPTGGSGGKGKSKPPDKPLSRDYIRDRIDIDDPIRGYQIRHRHGGWLQGFVLMTNFTTWTHYFKWDSTHPKSGMRFTGAEADGSRVGWDHDGSLSAQLERQPRSGDPNHGGVVWPTIAEISLVGALGCGEYLVRMALDDISRRDAYDYVVLQATDAARTFYERFGFVRVGAISKYGSQAAVAGAGAGAEGGKGGGGQANRQQQRQRQQNQQAAPSVGGSAPLVGYRHWTYADESSQDLSKAYGGPSYMMALKIDRSDADPNGAGHHCVECGRAVGKVSFLDALADCFVLEKPKVMPLGGTIGRRKPASTWGPGPVAMPKPSVGAGSGGGAKAGQLHSKPPAVPTSGGQRTKPPVKPAAGAVAAGRKRMHDPEAAPRGTEYALPAHRSKRMRVEEQQQQRGRPVTPVMSKYEQAQAEDIWLAVPPAAKLERPTKRKPPRPRGGDVPTTPTPTRRSLRGGGGGGDTPSDRPRPRDAPSKAKQQQQSKEKTTSSAAAKRGPLRKQRIPNMYRDPKKVYYYNKVVTPKKKGNLRSTTRPYYFVLHYEEDDRTVRIIPLAQRGTFIGKREGRVKWKATVVDRPAVPPGGSARDDDDEEKRYYSAMGVITVPCDEWDIVPAESVHKCAGVAEDSWDIFDD